MSIIVTNNPDGTYTVECGGETAVVGTPRGPIIFPPISSLGGGAVAYIINSPSKKSRGERVDNVNALIANLRNSSLNATRTGAAARPLEFSLIGQHSIDIGKIASAVATAADTDNMQVHIFVEPSHE
jgi:hypothetical protein